MGIELIANKYKKEKKDPERIWVEIELDALRRDFCLCINCDRKNDQLPYSSCPTAKRIYEICLDSHMSMAITKCGATDNKGKLLYKPLKEKE